jgi:hypothetical protein
LTVFYILFGLSEISDQRGSIVLILNEVLSEAPGGRRVRRYVKTALITDISDYTVRSSEHKMDLFYYNYIHLKQLK